MNRRFGVLAAAVCGMLLGLPGAQAADTWPVTTNWDTKDVSIRLATGRGSLVFQPGEFNLKAGELYRFVIVNDTGVNHSLSAPKFAGKVLTSGLMKSPASSDLTSMNIASGIVMRPGETMEWHLMPVTEGIYKFGCGNTVHAAAGMEATIHVL
jgi:uncharacterized cupredoxin-like copper-binding protein